MRLVGGAPRGAELDPAAAPPGLRDLQGQPFGRARFEALPGLEGLSEWLHVEFHAHSDLRAPDLPGVDVKWLTPWQRRADIEVGPIAINRQDVTDLLGVGSNHEAGDLVRAEVEPALRGRLTFDSEGHALSVAAATEADIRAAAAAILRRRSHP